MCQMTQCAEFNRKQVLQPLCPKVKKMTLFGIMHFQHTTNLTTPEP